MLDFRILCYFLAWASWFSLSSVAVEQFNEELLIVPLQDGRILSRFSFQTLLKGASPRDPRTLGIEDQCK